MGSGPGNGEDEISQQVFDHLVGLAALELEPEEAAYLRAELNGQLKAIRELEAIEVNDSTPITSHGVPYPPDRRSRLREDQARSSGLADAILDQAPEVEERRVVVPDIPQEELE